MNPNSLHSIKSVALSNSQTSNLPLENLFDSANQYGVKKCKSNIYQSFILAIFAGAFIAIAFLFYTTVTNGLSHVPWGMSELVGGFAFSLGLVLVVVCGGELFTSSILSSIAWTQ